MKKINWGIIGCGNIAHKFAQSTQALDNAQIVAVGSRTQGKAETFANKYSIDKIYTDYSSLLLDEKVDAVYIATTHNFHYENAKEVLNAGKHILCEKPFTVNSKELKDLLKIASEKKLFMMEAMWTRFLPAVVKVREYLDAKVIGDIKQIRASFGFKFDFDPENRLYNLELAGGALLDAGIYPLSFANMVMKNRPKEIKAIAEIGKTGVDEQSSYLFTYDSGCIAFLNSTINAPVVSRAEIIGTLGRITIPQGFLGANELWLDIEGKETDKQMYPFEEATGFKFEIEAASNSILAGELENIIMPLTDTLQIIETIDEIKAQLGLVYSNDKI